MTAFVWLLSVRGESGERRVERGKVEEESALSAIRDQRGRLLGGAAAAAVEPPKRAATAAPAALHFTCLYYFFFYFFFLYLCINFKRVVAACLQLFLPLSLARFLRFCGQHMLPKPKRRCPRFCCSEADCNASSGSVQCHVCVKKIAEKGRERAEMQRAK